MGDKVKPEAAAREINIPAGVRLGAAEENPAIIIETLRRCNGDVDKYCQQFTTRAHVANIEVMMLTMLVLDKPENAPFKAQWDALIEAFRKAKLLVAQNKACNAIANFNYPRTKAGRKSTQMTQDTVMKLTRFWYSDNTPTAEPPPPKVDGRRKVEQPEPAPAPTTPAPIVVDPLDDVLAVMQGGSE